MKKKSKFRPLIFFIFVLAALFLGIKSYWSYLLSPVNIKDTQPKEFIVQTGEATSEVAQRLQNVGLIRSSLAFSFYIKKSGSGGRIQAGNFQLSPAMSSEQILRQLTVGTMDKRITLIEGWRAEEMADKVSRELEIKKEDFLAAAKGKEGFLFPDTYLVRSDVKASELVTLLKSNFDKKYDNDLQTKMKKLGLTPIQGVILASIVEREARSDEVRQKVASILLRRLNIGMALQADATVQYVLGYQKDEKSWWKNNLTREDIKIESAYNTYFNPGLPPGPISNPSLSSLKAVANADPGTPYLYYYHDIKGNSYYAKTLEEHNENVANHR